MQLAELMATVPNLVIRTPDGIASTQSGDLSSFPREHFARLDDIPSPYQDGQIATADVGLLTARGCNQHCTYCSFTAVSGRRIEFHGVERVLDDLAAFKPVVERSKRRLPTVSFMDDAFSLAPQRARAICEGIIRRELQMPFDCMTRGDRVDPELLQLMKRAGMVSISFGLESAVPHVLRAIGKVQDPATRGDPGFDGERDYLEQFRKSIASAKEAGLSTAVSVMGGLPGESTDDFRATLAFVDQLGVASYAHNLLNLLPGTPLYRDRQQHGLRAERDRLTGGWRTDHRIDVSSIPPLPNAQNLLERWDEVHLLTDAICGRPRTGNSSNGAAWAVILHGNHPGARVAAWLSEVLSIGGAVLVVDRSPLADPSDLEAWRQALGATHVPWGILALLHGEEVPGTGLVLRSLGTLVPHRFELDTAWEEDRREIVVDESGRCRVPIWLTPRGAVHPLRSASGRLFSATAQLADGCRWWSGWRRCREPRVLHVLPDSTVSPCWNGPAIGMVGEPFEALEARGKALGGTLATTDRSEDRCPLQSDDPVDSTTATAVEEQEVASQMVWQFRKAAVASRDVHGNERGTT